MNKVIILAVILGFGSTLSGCGGTTKEKETPNAQTNVTASSANPPIANRSGAQNDNDGDDVRTANRAALNSNTAAFNQKRSDRDDTRVGNKSSNSNRGITRRDADDKDKSEPDRDADDH